MDFSSLFEFGRNLEWEATRVIPIIIGIILMLIQCFFGFKLFRYIITFWGFLLFGTVGYNIGNLFSVQYAGIIACIIFGSLGAFISYKYYKAGVFLQGFVAGFIIGLIVGTTTHWHIGIVFSTALGIGILLGLLTLFLLKPMIILTSGLSGGISSGSALAALFGFNPSVGMFLGIILSVLGVIYQFFGAKHKEHKDSEEKEDKKHKKDKHGEKAEETVIEDTASAVGEPITGEVVAGIAVEAEKPSEIEAEVVEVKHDDTEVPETHDSLPAEPENAEMTGEASAEGKEEA